MRYLQGQDRFQIHLFSLTLNDVIECDNEVRLIDTFVGMLNLEEMGFGMNAGENGRPLIIPGIYFDYSSMDI